MSTPTLLAEFELDSNQKPIYYQSGGHKHFKIHLYLEGTPSDAYSVTYELDPTYRVNKRTVPKSMPNFKERITSFGDYLVNVAISEKSSDSPSMIASPLSEALVRRYTNGMTPEIQEAIHEITEK